MASNVFPSLSCLKTTYAASFFQEGRNVRDNVTQMYCTDTFQYEYEEGNCTPALPLEVENPQEFCFKDVWDIQPTEEIESLRKNTKNRQI